MELPIQRIGRRMYEVIQQELYSWMGNLLKDSFNPETMLRFFRTMGIDMSQLTNMIGKQPGLDPYMVLGLDRSATDEEITKRYRALMAKLHPDVAGIEGTDFICRMVNASYELIWKERGKSNA